MGEALYKAGDPAQADAWQDPAELSRHLTLARNHEEAGGHVFFSAKSVMADRIGAMRRVVADYQDQMVTLAAPPPGVIELNGGYLHASLQPERALSAALARAGRRPGAWGRPPTDGLPELRSWFAREIGPAVSAADVLITAGGQSALATALRALAPPGAPVLVESPTYPGMLAAARATGLRPVPVPVDADGVRPELLADAFRATGARVLVTQPLFQNPTGATLAPARGPRSWPSPGRPGRSWSRTTWPVGSSTTTPDQLPAPLAADDPTGPSSTSAR
ncbi:hypothetical protein SBADM41S_12109 [Streptomyces badius]